MTNNKLKKNHFSNLQIYEYIFDIFKSDIDDNNDIYIKYIIILE